MRLPNWKSKNTETEIEDDPRRMQEAAWPDMFANLQSAYAELTNAQFELERRAAEIAALWTWRRGSTTRRNALQRSRALMRRNALRHSPRRA